MHHDKLGAMVICMIFKLGVTNGDVKSITVFVCVVMNEIFE